MNYTVDWSSDARNSLALIWMQATDRSAVASAQAAVDHLLTTNPFSYGSYVSEDLYSIEVPLTGTI